jgi:hypothetical protein
MNKFLSYCKHVLIALDQLANTLCGHMPDETISATAYRKSQEKGHYFYKFLKFVLDVTFSPIKQDHCFQSYLSEMTRKQLPERYRK